MKDFKLISRYVLKQFPADAEFAYFRYQNKDSANIILFVQIQNNFDSYKIIDIINLGKTATNQGIGVCTLNDTRNDILVIHEFNKGDLMSKIINAWEPNLDQNKIAFIDIKTITKINSGVCNPANAS
ncbi:MAG: hypothetical protein HC905_30540 [Bacteroidales bacterium]|nr:hypothetical protein [Bacteroidales bacterium]